MIIDVKGYFYTGADADAKIDGHAPLSLNYGESTTIRLAVFHVGDVPYDLTGKSLTLTVKRKSYDANPRLTKLGALLPADGLHRANFVLSAADMKLIPQRYVYDVWMAIGSTRNPVVRLSTFHVEPSARS